MLSKSQVCSNIFEKTLLYIKRKVIMIRLLQLVTNSRKKCVRNAKGELLFVEMVYYPCGETE